MNLVFLYINQVHWTRFLYIEIESIGLDFFLTTCLADQSNFQNVSLKKLTVLSLKKLTVSLIPFHSQSLSHSHSIPSCSVSLSFPLAPSPSISLTLIPSPATPSPAPSTSPLRSDAVAPPFRRRRRRRPNNRRVSFSHLISSMWFLGCLCVLEKWVVGFAYFLFLMFFFFFFFFFWCNVNWVKCLNQRLMGFWIFIFIKCLLLLLLLLYISVIWIEYETWYAQIMVTSK